ncbi:3-oxoacyl-[acyl-carrier-protein] synthase-3 [Paenibacillus uliginis N3/975]|uniref:3-oxoacyl-[acyl-carrier-protein] synthase-3 n=1 Tax=Paenibacillus uliginis N3/975 TaxID=1313296 RepID=A0A1X7HSX4_9BACL|nr:3-oxoacyl-[acyl-carrier-protein] synthase III C-terminal domain-containing protein [Paenibacillus uliginis]SMF91742.1 3-oxoacyl-[acyl-carrier-protein] synthase-3 [Paenibacillus uliginis N3/975]
MQRIRLKSIDIYHPNHSIDNEFYISHYKAKGKDITNFLEFMGRESRYVIDNDTENGLTMGIEAARRVLAKAGLTGEDMDMIMFSTQVPETTYPSNAMFVHAAIQGKSDALVMDSNANCAGMTVAVDHASRYMSGNPDCKRALVIGSDYNTLLCNSEDEITYANYGDAACAVILEQSEEEEGLIDCQYSTHSILPEKIMYPAQGLAKMVKEEADGKSIQWLPFDGHLAMPPTFTLLDKLLSRNGLTAQDVKAYCFSQFSMGNILKIQEHLELDDSQIVYVGDRFGYTGTSSPFIALYEGIESGRIQRGDTVCFWTIGCGFQLVAMLWKY